MTRILVVDDEADLELLIKQKFRQKIREHRYEFFFAAHGKEALEKITQYGDIDIVLSDINMPEMDGLTLLSKINEQSPLLKTVIVSAYGDMENIRIAMNRGAFDFLCKPVNFDDLDITIQKTIHHVGQLRQTLQAIKENNILKMYVDETVINFMNGKEFENSLIASETLQASVAFMDICGFTTITENQPAELVVNMLNKYFDIMVNEIITQNGYIDKFIGDAILAVFKGEYHLDRAVEASLAVCASIDKLPVETFAGKFHPKVSIGVHSGEMICGNIGSVSLRRLDYTVIGDVVNTAERLRGVAAPGQVLIAESSYHLIKEAFKCARIGEELLRNKSKPTTIYHVLE